METTEPYEEHRSSEPVVAKDCHTPSCMGCGALLGRKHFKDCTRLSARHEVKPPAENSEQ